MKHWWVPGLQIGYEHTFTHQFTEFVRAAAQGQSAPPTFRDGLATDCVTDAVLASARSPGNGKGSGHAETRNTTMVALVVAACVSGAPAAQQAGRGGGGRPQPLPFDDHTGFLSIFDGSSLKGWDGDPKFWRVEGGAIVGQTTADNPLKENTFIVWRGGEPADFELKLEYRIDATNSGIQIRSVHLPPGTPAGDAARLPATGC